MNSVESQTLKPLNNGTIQKWLNYYSYQRIICTYIFYFNCRPTIINLYNNYMHCFFIFRLYQKPLEKQIWWHTVENQSTSKISIDNIFKLFHEIVWTHSLNQVQLIVIRTYIITSTGFYPSSTMFSNCVGYLFHSSLGWYNVILYLHNTNYVPNKISFWNVDDFN